MNHRLSQKKQYYTDMYQQTYWNRKEILLYLDCYVQVQALFLVCLAYVRVAEEGTVLSKISGDSLSGPMRDG